MCWELINRKTKIKLILRCNMERPSNAGTIIQPSDFHSDVEINVHGRDEQELYDIMVERMLEHMATYQLLGALRLNSIRITCCDV